MKIGIYPKQRTSITLAARWLIAEGVEMKGHCRGVFPRSLTRRMHPECGPTVVQ